MVSEAEERLEEKVEEESVETVEEKPEVERKEEEEEDILFKYVDESTKILEERVYVVPLYKAFRYKRGLHRAKKAVTFLRRFMERHMKDPNIRISEEVNEIIWSRGIRNPPRRIKVRVVKTEDAGVWVLPPKD